MRALAAPDAAGANHPNWKGISLFLQPWHMSTDEVNTAIIETWYQQAARGDPEEYMPAVSPLFNDGQLLCVGYNPSMPQEVPQYFEQHFSNLDYPAFFRWENRETYVNSMGNANNPGISLQIESRAIEGYPKFYAKFTEIANELRTRWNHLDLFFCRGVKQSVVRGRVYTRGRNPQLNEFGRRQLDLAKELIVKANPRMVLVANATAAQVSEREFPARFDTNHCCYHSQIGRKNVPVFFSSMLTGGHLDRYSYERLLWLMTREWNRARRD
jgi:hypothetical protein